MRKLCLTVAAVAALVVAAGPAMAGKGGNGNGAPEGPHYNLNIIGVEKGKTVKMTGSERHTIFVALGRAGDAVETRIHLQPGDDFRVCDGNGFDPAYGCDEDVQLQDRNGAGKNGAVFMLPCNTLLPQGGNVNGDPIEVNVNCNETYTVDGNGDVIVVDKDPGDWVPVLAYEVWGRALGKPGDGVKATVQTCATVTEIDGNVQEEVCSLESAIFERPKGKVWNFIDVTKELTSLVVELCTSLDAEGNCDDTGLYRIALFAGETEDWFWSYQNEGVKLVQLRFYPVGGPAI